MAMSIAHRKTLDKTLEVLTEDMDVIPAIIHLKSKDILSDLDEEKINAKRTEKEKVTEFVKIIKKRGKKVYPTLVDYFQNCRGSEHLAEELDYNLKAVEEKLQGRQVERDGRRQIDIWNKFEEKFHCIRCKHDTMGQYNQLPDKINILLIGKTGSGKSATGNTILGKSYFKSITHSFLSVTKTIDLQCVKEDRFTITVIDTPGLFDVRGEDLLLEIAKTMIFCNGGIHLFLLVFKWSVWFTVEEQAMIDVIERILSKSVYNNCVVVMTNAYAQFGTKDKLSVREFAKFELDRGGSFAGLLNRVNRRIIAVENCFEDEFLSEKHRQRLLCYLAEVIHDNNGSMFSNTAFEYAKKRVEHQDTERKKRITREKELTQMRNQLHNFLLYEYLPENELNDITILFKKDLSYIRFHSGVQQFECVTKEDVKTYLESFKRENEPLIQKLKDVRIQQLRQQREYEERRRELLKKEGINKMQSIVLPLIGNRLRQMSAQQLEEIEEVEQLPDDVMKEVMECVKSCKMAVERHDITQFIKETFFENPTQIKRYKDEKIIQESLAEKAKQLKIVEKEQKLNAVMESLKSRLPVALDQKSDEELQELMSDLDDKSSSHQETWQPLFEELVDVTNSDLSSSELCESYLKKNYMFLQSVVVTTVEKRKHHKEATLRLQRERLRNSAYCRISERIEENVRSFLVGKNAENMQVLNVNLEILGAPPEIINEVSECLTKAENLALSDGEIELEVLRQIKEQNELIEKCKKEAECFPGSSMSLSGPADQQLPLSEPVGDTPTCEELGHVKRIINKEGGFLEIPGSAVRLEIPSGALVDSQTIEMHIIPLHYSNDPSSFCSNASVVVELLPSNLELQKEAKLTLPHCMVLKEGREWKAQVYSSHHDAGSPPRWKENPGTHSLLRERHCDVWLKSFSWWTAAIEWMIVRAKRICFFAAKRKTSSNISMVLDVGFYVDLVSAEKSTLMKYDMMLFERPGYLYNNECPLVISLEKIRSDHWSLEDENKRTQTLPFDEIAGADCSYCYFEFEGDPSKLNEGKCTFKMWQMEEKCSELLFHLTDPRSPSGMDSKVAMKDIEALSKEFGNTWREIARALDLTEAEMQNIEKYYKEQEEVSYQILFKWRMKKGNSATNSALFWCLRKAKRNDLADNLEKKVNDRVTERDL